MILVGFLKISIVQRGLVPKTTKAALNKLRADALYAIAEFWHDTFRPVKFTPRGARRWNFRRRKTKDIFSGRIKRDLGRFGPTSGNPLVWSGRSQQIATSTNITATRNRSTAAYGTRAFNLKPPGWPGGQMAREWKKINSSDGRQLARSGEKNLRAQFSTNKRQIRFNIN